MTEIRPDAPVALLPRLSALPLFLLLLFTVIATTYAPSQTRLYTLVGEPWILAKNFGQSIASAGDVDRDGHPDIIVGAPEQSPNPIPTEYARVYSGKSGRVLHTFRNTLGAMHFFGWSVSGAGDVNRDGYPDLIVGAPIDDKNGTDSGTAWVYSGRDGAILYTIVGDSPKDSLGDAVSSAGDVDRDGYADLLIGVPGDDNPSSNAGSARVYSGRNATIIYTFSGSKGGTLGRDVACAGDVNRDGFPDLIAGEPQSALNGHWAGAVRLFSGKDGSLLWIWHGNSPGDLFGSSVAAIGDVNRDDYPDIAAGAPRADGIAGADVGSVRVFSGKDGQVLVTIWGDSPGDEMGYVSGLGDLNRDGCADLLVVSSVGSYVRVISGADGKPLWTLRGPAIFGRSISGVGDVNGDSHVDAAIGEVLPGVYDCVHVFSGVTLALSTDVHSASLAQGGAQTFALDAGAANATKPYLLLGSASGTLPGVNLGPVLLPLALDAYFVFSFNHPNAWISNSLSYLDSAGTAHASVTIPRGSPSSLAGLVLYHAYVVATLKPLSFDLASNAVPLLLEP